MVTGLRAGVVVAAALAACVLTSQAGAAQLVDRNAGDIHLGVATNGIALFSYSVDGKVKHVLARGGINALAPTRAKPQEAFEFDYLGGQKFFGKPVWKTMSASCRPYDGPKIVNRVAACKAADGSYWALQAWEQALPNLGFVPWLLGQKDVWLELSHWSGPLAKLDVWQAWARGHRNALFGTLTYLGKPVYGFGTTRYGAPTDDYGRLVYLDSFGSEFGTGWVRQDSFVAGQPSGEFCYAMVPRDPTIGGYFAPPGWKKGTMRSAAIGTRYRLIAEGPGVTPLVQWDAAAFHSFDPVNPDDVVYDLRNLARVQALGANNHCLEGQSGIRARPLSSLRDDFHGGISSAKWNAPVTTGGATVTSGPSGLTFSLPAGSHSTAALASASGKLEPRASPVFVDLGPSGVPDGTSFDIRLFTTIGYQNGGTWNGLKVANGHLQVLRHYMYKGTPGHWLRTPEPRDEVALSVPYDSTSMRWLYLWIRGKEASVFTSPDSNTWHKVGGTDMTNWGLSPARLQFLVTGDGTVAASVSIATVSL